VGSGAGVEVWVVLQLGLCWRLDSEEGGTFLELNGDVEDGAWIGCWNEHVGGVGGVGVGVVIKVGKLWRWGVSGVEGW
jgi:hypothetical protein